MKKLSTLVVLLYLSTHLYAQWNGNTQDNTSVCTSCKAQSLASVSDGSGGAIFIWQDWRNGYNYDIYAQRIDAYGQALWGNTDLVVCNASSVQEQPTAISDGSGGVIIAWLDRRNGNSDIYAQQVSATGVVQWAANGVAVVSNTNGQYDLKMTTDHADGAYLVWRENNEIFGQRINPDGVAQWGTNGVQLTTGNANYGSPRIASNPAGGFFMGCERKYYSSWFGYVYRLDVFKVSSSGSPVWFQNLVILTGFSNRIDLNEIVFSGSRIFASYKNGIASIQDAGSSGTGTWTFSNGYSNKKIAPDGSGGIFLSWSTGSTGYIQRFNSSGGPVWGSDKTVCTGCNVNYLYSLINDGGTDANLTWSDSYNKFYTQRINSHGDPLWGTSGLLVCSNTSSKTTPLTTTAGTGIAIVGWADNRSSGIYKVQAAKIINGVQASQCPPDDIVFSTQADIDNFSTNYPNCTALHYGATVSGGGVVNLNGLSVLSAIGGNLKIENTTNLNSLSGLGNLTQIGKSLAVLNNTQLNNMSALAAVTGVGGNLQVTGNSKFTDLSGLGAVTGIAGSIEITNNALLTSLNGLTSLNTVGGLVKIGQNSKLTTWTSIGNVTAINGNLMIYNNPLLENLQGLSAITSISGALSIAANDKLTNLHGLEALATISNKLDITGNSELGSLDGLDNLTTLTGPVSISGNRKLSYCEAAALCSYLGTSGSATIQHNLAGCNSPTEVQAFCNPVCPTGSLTFSSQAEVNDFTTTYPGCRSINHDVTISGADIENLNGLETVNTINGALAINNNPLLESLHGIRRMLNLTGPLTITNNPNLTTCNMTGICDYIDSGGAATINSNLGECLDQATLVENCVPAPPINMFGMTHSGGSGTGTLFRIISDGSAFQAKPFNAGGSPWFDKPLLGSNGHIYGTLQSGASGNGELYDFDPNTGVYTTLFVFNVTNGKTPLGALAEDSGKIYGVTNAGGANGGGAIYAFETATSNLTLLYHFSSSTGSNPLGGVSLSGGKLYGIAGGGTNGGGVIYSFDLVTNTYTVLHNFTSATGNNPRGTVLVLNNILYGTTRTGGSSNFGVVYALNLSTNTYTVKHNFSGTNDGSDAFEGLIENGGLLYGATSGPGGGVLYSLNPSNNAYTVKYNFTASINGSIPYCGLLFHNGQYGTTNQGGANGDGVIFSYNLTTDTYSVVYQLQAATGENPHAGLLIAGDKLYGTTNAGGTKKAGVIYSFNLVGNTYQMEYSFPKTTGSNPHGSVIEADGKLYGMATTVLYSYDPLDENSYEVLKEFGLDQGSEPVGTPIEVNGKFYGMTRSGGNPNTGRIYSYDPATGKYKVEYGFENIANGYRPLGSLFYYNGLLYGMTTHGGANLKGVIFSFDPITKVYTVIHHFETATGWPDVSSYGVENFKPELIEHGGSLYGATRKGGTNDKGVIFSYNLAAGTYNVEHAFSALSDPSGQFVVHNNALYSTTRLGGLNNQGAIFSFDFSGTLQVVFDFENSNGSSPYSGPAISGNYLYGVTYNGGANGIGTIYKYNILNDLYEVLHHFTSTSGSSTKDRLLVHNNTLYGIARLGGSSGSGVIFSIHESGGNYSVLKNFGSATTDPKFPEGGVFHYGGLLFGTTQGGGNGSFNPGVIFSIGTTGSNFAIKHNFGNKEETLPWGSLIKDNNKLYGMTQYGGSFNAGVIFSYTLPNGPYEIIHVFDEINGGRPYGDLLKAGDMLYGMTSSDDPNASGSGILFSFNVISGVYTVFHQFQVATGHVPYGSLVLLDGKLYGMTSNGSGGGINGTLFSYEISSNSFTVRHAFVSATGHRPNGSLLLSGNKFYGLTSAGGDNSGGALFSFTPSNNVYTVLHHFNSATGSEPWGSLIEYDRKLFGTTSKGGSDNLGVLFYYDLDEGTYAVLKDLDNVDGKNPYGSLFAFSQCVPTNWYKDNDADGYGDTDEITVACLPPTGYSGNSGDCNDNDPNEHPGQIWYNDGDVDGWGSNSVVSCGRPPASPSLLESGSGSTTSTNYLLISELAFGQGDCNDDDGDETPGQIWYADNDSDGWGGVTQVACERPSGHFLISELANGAGDCNDNNNNEFPGQVWYPDEDNDGYGGDSILACERPLYLFLTGELTHGAGDCEDADPDQHPGQTWYPDSDGDGWGGGPVVDCERPYQHFLISELANSTGDCNDGDPLQFPGQTWYIDADADGYGSSSIEQCERPTNGFVLSELSGTGTDDCDDADPLEYPGQTWYLDADADDYGGSSVVQCLRPTNGFVLSELSGTGTDDCNDADPLEYPGQTWYLDADADDYGGSSVVQCLRPTNGFVLSELSGTGTDDCNDADPLEYPGQTWYLDADADDYGGSSVVQCLRPTNGFVLSELSGTGTDDCDDADPLEFPGQTWYPDLDLDGWGGDAVSACERPTGYFVSGELPHGTGDCNDSNGAIYPGAAEICNGLDDDCSGSPESAANMWIGAGDATNWSDPINWSDGNVPLYCQNVVIPDGYNVLIAAGIHAVGATLEVGTGSVLDVQATATLSITDW